MELQLTDERLMTVSKELAEKGNVVSMLASQVQVRCALRSWVWNRCQGFMHLLLPMHDARDYG